MYIHFACLVDGNQQYFQRIVNEISKLGHTLVTYHYLKRTIKEIENESPEESQDFHTKFISWMKKSDIIVYEITKNDINAGYEVSHALSMNKPVIILYEKGKCQIPYVFKGIESDLLQMVEYEIEEIDYYISEAITYATKSLNVRYNLFLTPRQNYFLDRIAKRRLLSKSSIIRDLIDKEMLKEKDISEKDLSLSHKIE